MMAMRQLPEFHIDAQDVAIIEPCTQEVGAFMVDFNLFRFLNKKQTISWMQIDFKILSDHVKSIEQSASKTQLSDRLGICKITCPKWEFIVARSGRIVVRRAQTREVIDQAVNFIFSILEGCLK